MRTIFLEIERAQMHLTRRGAVQIVRVADDAEDGADGNSVCVRPLSHVGLGQHQGAGGLQLRDLRKNDNMKG